MDILKNKIKEAVAQEVSAAMEGINGPSIHPTDITVSSDYRRVTIELDLYIIRDDDYIGICSY